MYFKKDSPPLGFCWCVLLKGMPPRLHHIPSHSLRKKLAELKQQLTLRDFSHSHGSLFTERLSEHITKGIKMLCCTLCCRRQNVDKKFVLKLSFRQNFISNNRSLVKGKLNVTALRPKRVVAFASTKGGVILHDKQVFQTLVNEELRSSCVNLLRCIPRRRGGGGNPSDGDDRMGANIKAPQKSLGLPTKPPKISGPKINPQKPHAEFFQALKISRKQTEVWL